MNPTIPERSLISFGVAVVLHVAVGVVIVWAASVVQKHPAAIRTHPDGCAVVWIR